MEGERITSGRWLQEYKKEYPETPLLTSESALFSDSSAGDARIPSMDPALRTGSSSLCDSGSTQTGMEERVSTQDLITDSLLAEDMNVHKVGYDYASKLCKMGHDPQTETPSIPSEQETTAAETLKTPSAATQYVDTVGKWDILSERGAKGNHYTGNKRYRNLVSKIQPLYNSTAVKKTKTKLSKLIVECVKNYGGRFLKKDKQGRYLEMSTDRAVRKTSQALREIRHFRWTHVDAEDDVERHSYQLALRTVNQG